MGAKSLAVISRMRPNARLKLSIWQRAAGVTYVTLLVHAHHHMGPMRASTATSLCRPVTLQTHHLVDLH